MSLPTQLDWQPDSSSTRVILMRHGQSTYNAEKRHQGSSDASGLTEQGRRTADQTGLLLQDLDINTIYTSPLRRTQETAQAVVGAIAPTRDHPPTVIAHPALQEISLPLWDGLPYHVVRTEFAKAYRCWKEQPDQFQMMVPSEENRPSTGALTLASLTQPRYPVLDLYEQAQQFWREILPRHLGQTLLIVSHAGTNRALISTALGMTPNHFHTLQQSNCGISILQFPNTWEQSTRLEGLNLTDHLGEVLPKLKEGKQGLRLLIVPLRGEIPNRIQALTKRLATVEIDVSISTDLNSAQPAIDQLLHNHPETVQLSVLREDFCHAWQQALVSQRPQVSSANITRPLTALVVVNEINALRLLSQLLEIQPQHLQVTPGTLSVIHYPHTSNRPVLQAMNLA